MTPVGMVALMAILLLQKQNSLKPRVKYLHEAFLLQEIFFRIPRYLLLRESLWKRGHLGHCLDR